MTLPMFFLCRAPRFAENLAKARDRAAKLAARTRLPVLIFRAGQNTFRVITESQAEAEGLPAHEQLARVTP